jgi:hypothetical protein
MTVSFEVFICYKRLSAKDFAETLKKSLEEFGVHAFLDTKDIPTKFKGTEEWTNARDKAVIESKTFVLIITAGFDLSPEIKQELSLARKYSNKKFVYFRHKSLNHNLKIILDTEKLDLGIQTQIPFGTENDLVRKAHSVLVGNQDVSALSNESEEIIKKNDVESLIETRKIRMEHSTKLKDGFFKPWLETMEEYKDKCCEIGAKYSKVQGRMVSLKPKEPGNFEFYEQAMNHMKRSKLAKDWNNLKHTTLDLNEELAIIFEEIRVLILKEIDLPYWCPRYIGDYFGDKPDEYLCPDLFISSIYLEVRYRIAEGRKRIWGPGKMSPKNVGNGKMVYFLSYWDFEIASSPDEELMRKTQQLLSRLVEDKELTERIKSFVDKQKATYDKELEKVKLDTRDLINSIELGNVIKGKCRHCPKFPEYFRAKK